jgi:hydroxymethylglutaryl-CoA lyase
METEVPKILEDVVHPRIFEVALRDGLQNESVVLSTDVKVELAAALIRAGFTDLEVTSFVSPRWVPQLADAADLVRRLPRLDGVRYWALVPNQKGLGRALESGLKHVATVLSASGTHNQHNLNSTTEASLAALRGVIREAVAEGVEVRAFISTAFGCPFEGAVHPETVVRLASVLREVGARYIVLGDTTGMAYPDTVVALLDRLEKEGIAVGDVGVHFHDTRGTALLNAHAAFQRGVRMLDSAVGGVGGCPYAPGAAGNLATEDLVQMLDGIGSKTGIELDNVCSVGELLERSLGRTLPGRYHQYWQAQQRARRNRST